MKIVKIIIIAVLILTCAGCQKKVFFGVYNHVDSVNPQMTEIKGEDKEILLEALENIHLEPMANNEYPAAGLFNDREYYCLKISDGLKKKEIHLYSFFYNSGRIMVNDERYFADLYDDLFTVLRKIGNNNGILLYDYHYQIFQPEGSPYIINKYFLPLFDINGYNYGTIDQYEEFVTYYTYMVNGDAPVDEVFNYFDINVDAQQSLKEWYLERYTRKSLITSEVIYDNIGIKLLQINMNDQYVFIMKDLRMIEPVRIDAMDWYKWCYPELFERRQ